jgi:hypothetical protein
MLAVPGVLQPHRRRSAQDNGIGGRKGAASALTDWASTTPARVGRLLTDPDGPQAVLLLGAGASVSSGVPGAAPLAEMAARWAYCREHGRAAEDPSVTRSDWLPWLRGHQWYQPAQAVSDHYPTIIEHLLLPRSERRRFFTAVLRATLPPSDGYQSLARLVGKGWIRTVLTTNFDDLIPQSLKAEASVVTVDEVSGADEAHLISTAPPYPQVIFLHGRVEQYTDANLETETQHLPAGLRDALLPLLRDHPLLVIGYRGAERSIMVDLLGHADSRLHFPHGVYWCVRGHEDPHPLVQDLAGRLGGNFQLVPIDGFDQALTAWDQAAPSTARRLAHSSGIRVPELRPVEGVTLEALDWPLVQDSLAEYAERLDWPVPENAARSWYVARLVELGMVTAAPAHTPTKAGLVLFGRDPRVTVHIEHAGGRETVAGNLLRVLDRTLMVLAELNSPFRVKGPTSVTVRPYPPAALKEVVANAVVHRSYDTPASVRITVGDQSLQVVSPGGLVADVAADRLGEPGVRGYRNPVIADFCFGVGSVDKAGSGLTNVARWCGDNAGSASFGPRRGNSVFVAVLRARPERPDPATGTAEPDAETQIFLSNVCPLLTDDAVVYVTATDACRPRELLTRTQAQLPPFVLDNGRVLTFADPASDPAWTVLAEGGTERFMIDDLVADPAEEALVIELIHRTLIRHAEDQGMIALLRHRRLYFPRVEQEADDFEPGPEGRKPVVQSPKSRRGRSQRMPQPGSRSITYRARTKSATRVVTKPVGGNGERAPRYWQHMAIRFSVRRFSGQWGVLLVPGWVFTLDGRRELLRGPRVGPLATRLSAHEYNQTVANHLYFWLAMLVDGQGPVQLPHSGLQLSRDIVSRQITGAPVITSADDDLIDVAAVDLAAELSPGDHDDVDEELAALADEQAEEGRG